MKRLMILPAMVLGCALGGAVVSSTPACTPAQSAIVSRLESIVLDDINAGKGFPQAVADASVYLATQPGFSAVTDIVTLVSDVIRELIDLGVIPAPKLEHAKAMLIEAQTYKSPTK